ncbi:MAG: hypothetical protein CL693_22095 [Cellvibrionaceae bacterium]|jgi:hypothetical protein|nr:hypothetical protein [Cellvibrionaceae bacterium]|tara:strand:- start:8986 stop:10170 length:1185 start_codon:yes stop_codon:yes gene_type:complete
MAQFAICRTKKISSFGGVGGCGHHIDRTRNTPNADPDRQHLNRALVGERKPLAGLVRQHIGDAKMTKGAPLAFEVLLTGSPVQMRKLRSQDRFEEWVDANVSWLRDQYGDNLIRAELHMDESTPHIHAVVVPVVEKFDKRAGEFTGVVRENGYREREGAMVKRVNAGHYLNGRQKLSELQDSYAEAMKPLGLERGKRGSTARHTTIKEYYAHAKSLLNNVSTEKPDIKVPEPPEPKLTESKASYGRRVAEEVAKKMMPVINRVWSKSVRDKVNASEQSRLRTEAEARSERAETKIQRWEELEDVPPQVLEEAANQWHHEQLEQEAREAQRIEQQRLDELEKDTNLKQQAKDQEQQILEVKQMEREFQKTDDRKPNPAIQQAPAPKKKTTRSITR